MTEKTYSVGVIVGSVSEPSLNRRFAAGLAKMAPEAGLEFADIPISELPFYGTQYDREYPTEGRAFKAAVDLADALLIVTPEYNRSVPGVLKNAVDWATRPVGESSFPDKPVAVIGASKGVISTAVAQAQLKSVLVSQGAAVLGRPEAYIRVGDDFFTSDDVIADAKTREFLVGYLRAFRTHIARYA